MVSQVINVGTLMRSHAYTEKGKRNTKDHFRVSPGAIQEYLERIVDSIETNMPIVSDIAKRHNRSTVFEEDIIEYFGFKDSKIANGDRQDEL